MRRVVMILLIMVAAVAVDAVAQGRYAWRDVQSVEAAKPVNNPHNMDGIEVYSRRGVLIVRLPERAQVAVMTILGQTISKTVLTAGLHELPIVAHGIYIVMINDFTLRVAV